jgi:transposase
MPLPGYSPDPMPVEALWRWLREDVTYHHCQASRDDLIPKALPDYP